MRNHVFVGFTRVHSLKIYGLVLGIILTFIGSAAMLHHWSVVFGGDVFRLVDDAANPFIPTRAVEEVVVIFLL